jgi:hypothetical protein
MPKIPYFSVKAFASEIIWKLPIFTALKANIAANPMVRKISPTVMADLTHEVLRMSENFSPASFFARGDGLVKILFLPSLGTPF